MKTYHATLIGLLVSASFLGTSNVSARTLNIDPFQDPYPPNINLDSPQSVEVKSSSGVGASSFSESDDFAPGGMFDSILGGYRDLYLELLETTGTSQIRGAYASVFDGSLGWSNDTNVKSRLTLTWDGNDDSPNVNYTGLGGVDLTSGNFFDALGVQIIEGELAGVEVTINVYTDANNYSSLMIPLGLAALDNPPPYYSFDYANFNVMAGNGANFQNVGAVEMILNAPKEDDILLRFARSRTGSVGTPEPTVSLISLAGLSFLGSTLFKRKKETF